VRTGNEAFNTTRVSELGDGLHRAAASTAVASPPVSRSRPRNHRRERQSQTAPRYRALTVRASFFVIGVVILGAGASGTMALLAGIVIALALLSELVGSIIYLHRK
jgi:hypothetical protein